MLVFGDEERTGDEPVVVGLNAEKTSGTGTKFRSSTNGTEAGCIMI
jgi:hypothetical protein